MSSAPQEEAWYPVCVFSEAGLWTGPFHDLPQAESAWALVESDELPTQHTLPLAWWTPVFFPVSELFYNSVNCRWVETPTHQGEVYQRPPLVEKLASMDVTRPDLKCVPWPFFELRALPASSLTRSGNSLTFFSLSSCAGTGTRILEDSRFYLWPNLGKPH